jgi:creatinine amidohydrolase/Fe(II)-dependent formamide hydrolase-like protein
MLLKELKTTYFDPNKKYTFILPMGATEQHGPFLPLGTDTYCQNAILETTVRECPEAIILPTLEITCSKEHQGFPGTVWLEKETLLLVMRDICTSLRDQARHIIFISWHGGNLSKINLFIREYVSAFPEINLHHINLDPEDILEQTRQVLGGPVDDHAGNTETSMMLAVEESLTTIPPEDYPKQQITADWDADNPLKNVSPDGIADNHPAWIVNKKQGEKFVKLASDHLAKEVANIMKQ